MTRRTGKWSTRDMTAIALMAVLMCLCTWIAVPGAVPFTLQTFAVFAAVELLGAELLEKLIPKQRMVATPAQLTHSLLPEKELTNDYVRLATLELLLPVLVGFGIVNNPTDKANM